MKLKLKFVFIIKLKFEIEFIFILNQIEICFGNESKMCAIVYYDPLRMNEWWMNDEWMHEGWRKGSWYTMAHISS